MRYKTLTETKKKELEKRIKLLLFAGLDWCVNVNKDSNHWFSPNNPYFSEAHGIIQALEVLGYGYFGYMNDPQDGKNLTAWFYSLVAKVRESGEELGPSNAYQNYKKHDLV